MKSGLLEAELVVQTLQPEKSPEFKHGKWISRLESKNLEWQQNNLF